jgi:hypothetical protein
MRSAFDYVSRRFLDKSAQLLTIGEAVGYHRTAPTGRKRRHRRKSRHPDGSELRNREMKNHRRRVMKL